MGFKSEEFIQKSKKMMQKMQKSNIRVIPSPGRRI